MAGKLNHWAIVFNPAKAGAAEQAKKLERFLKKHKCRVEAHGGAPESLEGFDAAATIGGDGTLLGCVSAALAGWVPLVGVNVGHLGYLTSTTVEAMEESFEKILAGEWVGVERMVLKATFPDGGARYALNDVVIKSAEYRMAELEVKVDGELAAHYDCDGIILATPTGSTAYNLSAGGPILHRGVDGIVMTPICAHTLANRSVVFNSRSRVSVHPSAENGSVRVAVDGRAAGEGLQCLPLQVRQATRKLVTLEAPAGGTFETMREKLGW